MKILVNKCPDTGKLFESDQEFKQFRRRHLAQKKADENKGKADQLIQESMMAFQESCDTFSELEVWITKNTKKIISHSCVDLASDLKFKHLKFYDMQLSDAVNNSHSAPKHGVTNWYRDSNLPRGYPGWHGRLQYTASHTSGNINSSFFRLLRVHTGTGGGHINCSYEVKLFQSDWPGLGITERLMQGV